MLIAKLEVDQWKTALRWEREALRERASKGATTRAHVDASAPRGREREGRIRRAAERTGGGRDGSQSDGSFWHVAQTGAAGGAAGGDVRPAILACAARERSVPAHRAL